MTEPTQTDWVTGGGADPPAAAPAAAGPATGIDGQHRIDTTGASGSEPVLIGHLITTGLYALAGTGWVVLDDNRIAVIATAGAFVLSQIAAFAVRARVSPAGRITWDNVRSELESMVWAEISRVAASATALPMITEAVAPSAGRHSLLEQPPEEG